MIMYAPKIIPQHQIFDGLGGQIDLFPTTMHLLRMPYVNNTMGIDLFSEQRNFIYFSADQKHGVISDSLFLIISKNNNVEGLFRYRNSDTVNYYNLYRETAHKMKKYGDAHFQVSQFIISNRKQNCN
jgi:phosphoglycerol transferase MdoB-like AlkP superfamily enzyme